MIKNIGSQSPHSYFEEFNKRAATENCYPKSQNPKMFMWKLSFQQLNKFIVPQNFYDTREITVHKTIYNRDKSQEIQQTKRKSSQFQDDHESTLSNQRKLKHQKTIVGDSFLLNSQEYQQNYKLQLMKDDQQLRKQITRHKQHTSQSTFATKEDVNTTNSTNTYKQMHLEKLQHYFKDNFNQNNIKTENQQKKTNQQLIPKINKDFNRPINQFLSLVNSTQENFKHSSQKTVVVKKLSLLKQNSQPTPLKTEFENNTIKQLKHMDSIKQLSQCSELQKNYALNNGGSFQKSDISSVYQPYRMRRGEELSGYSEQKNYQFGQKLSSTKRKQRSSIIVQEKLQDRVKEVFNTEEHRAQLTLNPHKYFYNFNKYFLTNYQQSGNVHSKLSKVTEGKLQTFENNIHDMINDKHAKSYF